MIKSENHQPPPQSPLGSTEHISAHSFGFHQHFLLAAAVFSKKL